LSRRFRSYCEKMFFLFRAPGISLWSSSAVSSGVRPRASTCLICQVFASWNKVVRTWWYAGSRSTALQTEEANSHFAFKQLRKPRKIITNLSYSLQTKKTLPKFCKLSANFISTSCRQRIQVPRLQRPDEARLTSHQLKGTE
jgi:hypothetical protein